MLLAEGVVDVASAALSCQHSYSRPDVFDWQPGSLLSTAPSHPSEISGAEPRFIDVDEGQPRSPLLKIRHSPPLPDRHVPVCIGSGSKGGELAETHAKTFLQALLDYSQRQDRARVRLCYCQHGLGCHDWLPLAGELHDSCLNTRQLHIIKVFLGR